MLAAHRGLKGRKLKSQGCNGRLPRGIPRPRPRSKGPKIEEIQDRSPGLKFSSEIEDFKRARIGFGRSWLAHSK